MPLIDNFNYVPNAEDLDYDRDAMSLLQIVGPSCPSLDAWPEFFSRPIDVDNERSVACKVAEDDRRAGATLEVPLVPEEPGGRPELTFGDLAHLLHDLQHLWEVFAAVEMEEEGRVLYVNTWYSDHVRFPHCAQSRPVRLGADPWNWPDQFAEAWDDRVDPDALIEIHLIQPTPSGYGRGGEGVPHVVLVQHANPTLRSIHVFVIDAAASGTTARAFVDVIPERVTKQDFYDRLGIGDAGMVSSLIDCMISHGDFDLQYHDVYPTRHGFSFLVIMNHLRDIITRAAAATEASASSSGTHLLQIGATKKSIFLAELISEVPQAETPLKDAVRVVWACAPGPHPSFIEIDQDATASAILLELQSWGLDCRIVDCRERGEIICFPSFGLTTDVFHYVLVNMDRTDEGQTILHSSNSRMRTKDLMEFLYALGFWRAVILSSDEVHPGIYKIGFHDQHVVIEPPNSRERGVPQWPPQQMRTQALQPHFQGCRQFDSQQLIDLGITEQDVRDLFLSHADTLTTELPQDVPQDLADAVAACDQSIANKNWDRLVIYTDGSSLSCHKHLPPLRAEEDGHGDTWAMVILGECYDPPRLQFLGWCAHPVIYDEEHSMHLGAQRLGADVAEREGLCWAALWRLSQNWRVATCFRSDSKMALGQAEGIIGSAQQDETFKFLRGAFQANEAALGVEGVAYSHVPGHAGECWNELCDWLAKRERMRSFFCRRPNLDMRKWRKAIGHVWMLFGQHPDLPQFCGQGLHAPAPQLPSPTPLKQPDEEHSQFMPGLSSGKFTLSACSANVNSLSRGPDGHEGKISYLREQFKTLKLNFLGIQEAKTQEICTLVDQVYRLASGCAGRHQGVELWINLAQPYCWVDGHPRFFTKNDFQIAYKDSRVLLVRTDTRYWNGWLLVAYAPHSGLSRLDREEWWRHLTEVAHRRKRHEPLIIMIDANAAPGQEDGQAVFGSGGSTSASTDLLRTFVAEHELCMPCTTSAHQGSTNTWTDPMGKNSYCIDYVLLSPELASACNLSRVVTEFDLGHGHWDHEAVAVQLAWTDCVVRDERKKKGGCSFDPAQLTSQICIDVLDAHEPVGWEVDIETQVEAFNAHVHHELHRRCPKRRNQPKKAYITDELWQLRAEKLALKERLREVGRRARDERLVSFFKSWASAKNQENQIDAERFHHYEVFLLCSQLRLTANYRHTARKLRDGLRFSKKKLIQQKFETMHPDATAAHILHEMKPILGPTNLKKLKVGTLPYVQNPDGDHCSLPNEAIGIWSEFFRHMEGGTRMSKERQRTLWRANLASFCQDSFSIAATDLPSLVDLEAAFRRIHPDKAVGPDDIHPAFCKNAPHRIARKTYGQLLKLLTHGQEALAHKGGVLHPIWKMKGPRDLCSSYRSILISSHVGKSLHRSIRQHQTHLFSKFLQREQVGGRPKIPVTLGVHMGRAFLRSRRSQRQNVGMLYLDLTEAFYRILRPLVVGGAPDDELIMHVGARVGLSTDLLKDLHTHLEEPTALEQANMPRHLRNALHALHEDTHFHVRGQLDTCRTALGSRPGDCFADVVFSYLWGRILLSLERKLTAMGLNETIPEELGLCLPDARRSIEAADTRNFLGPTWMDDTCVCVTDSCPTRLERKISQATSQLLGLCESHGLSPNLQPGKSEVLLAFQGRGSKGHEA